MNSHRRSFALACLLGLATPLLAGAAEPATPATPAAPSMQEAAAAATLKLKAEYFAEFDEAADKIQQLAAAMPADKYGWRPAAGVRSVGEVFMHVAGGEYFIMKMAGTPPPADWPKDPETTVVAKDQIAVWLARSIKEARSAVEQAGPEQMEKSIDFFGRQLSGRGLYLRMLNHMNEHLGQAIAYARMNGVTPPWSKGSGG